MMKVSGTSGELSLLPQMDMLAEKEAEGIRLLVHCIGPGNLEIHTPVKFMLPSILFPAWASQELCGWTKHIYFTGIITGLWE